MVICLKPHWALFLCVQMIVSQCWSRKWLCIGHVTSHYVNQWRWLQRYHSESLNDNEITHCSRVTHLCVSKVTTIGSDNGLSPGRRQAIIWTNGGILLTGSSGTNFSEISIEIHTFSFQKVHMSPTGDKWSSSRCAGLLNWAWRHLRLYYCDGNFRFT